MEPVAIPDTPAGRRMAWVLDKVGVSGWSGAVDRTVEVADAFIKSGDAALAEVAGQVVECVAVAIQQDTHEICTILVQNTPMRRTSVRLTVEAEAPHRIQSLGALRALPEGVSIRPARTEDGAELAELCRQTPIILDDGSTLVIDPGEDYWDATRLMESARALVAATDDRIIAVQLGTRFEARYGGRHQLVAIVLHVRVHPDYARSGIRSVIQRMMQGASAQEMQRAQESAGVSAPAPGTDTDRTSRPRGPLALTGISYVSEENVTTMSPRLRAVTWKCQPYRVVLPCPMSGAARAGRPATLADASDIVRIINTCHHGEELFLEYTEDHLSQRLMRAPDLYTWNDVLIGEGAVVGTWMARQRRTWTRGDDVTTSVRGMVVDFGFLPGHEDEFMQLLGATSLRARELGMTHLSIFTSDGSAGSKHLRDAAETIERYNAVNPFTPEPEGTVERGMWVDQIHF